MKRMTYFVMALALVLGFTQCKKEQIEPQNGGNSVMITLNVDGGDNNGSKAEVTPPHVNFVNGDRILVACAGHYVGTLINNDGTNFSGEVSDQYLVAGESLYFYFLGNQEGALEDGATNCTVNISDQRAYPTLPVISMGVSSDPYSSNNHTYSSRLYNKASLMKFNVTTPSTTSICITGMNNLVTVNFAAPEGITNGFTYDKEGEGIIKMAGGSFEERWIIVLPQAALEETGEAFSEDNAYFGTRPALSAITTDQYLSSGVSMTVNTPAWDGDLSTLTASSSERYATATDGMTISGTLAANVKVSIADGATVTLSGANINNNSKSVSLNCAGITCLGSATINLADGTINNINSSSDGYPGIQAGSSGNTLTIQGSGTLNAQGGSNAPGIGGGNGISCGKISLLGGTISACGGDNAPGLGNGQNGLCGDIEISNSVEKLNITGGSGASKSISTSDGSSLSIDNLDDVSYFDTIPFVYHPVNLSDLTGDYVAENGDVFRGELTHNVTINDPNATITLSGVSINYGGIICAQPNVRIVCFNANSLIANNGAGIQAPSSGKISIEGTGSLDVQSTDNGCAGIGSNISTDCGDIYIKLKGGKIIASGGNGGAGIGSGQNGSCVNIKIEGSEIEAYGLAGGAGIGSGQNGSCVNIEIEGSEIKAYGIEGGAGIGSGKDGSCGDIEIEGSEIEAYGYGNDGIGAGDGGHCGEITIVTIDDPEWVLSGLFSVSDYKQVRFSRGNLLSNGTFATNQYAYGDLISSDDGYSGPTDNWYALTLDEWRYLYQHSTCGFATVDGIHGLIILPDNYSGSAIIPYDSQNANHELWNDNTYTVSEWTEMENNGVVFLPAQFQGQNFEGYYLSSSSNFLSVGLFMFLCEKGSIDLNTGTQNWDTDITDTYGTVFHGYSVRLVKTN